MSNSKIAALLPDVSSRYGAPMGRPNRGIAENCEPGSIHLFRVALYTGGYDRGGAYWGHGAPIYCATDGGDYFATVRASTRERAALQLDLLPEQMRRAPRADVLRYLVAALDNRAHMPAADWKRADLIDSLEAWGPKTGRAAAAIAKLRRRDAGALPDHSAAAVQGGAR